MPVIPACHGRLYSAWKFHGSVRKRSSRLTMLGMRSSGSGSSQRSVRSRAAIQFVGQMMSKSMTPPVPRIGARIRWYTSLLSLKSSL